MDDQTKTADQRWPQGALVYQIYPRSFQDSNGDGIGDLPGITSRLDYLKDLGVTAIWLSPFYPSPMADFGYDVADYCDIHPDFGTLDDFKQLLSAAHQRNIKLIVDLVPNHSSDEHAWFKQSSASHDNDYADWYIWRDGSVDDAGHRRPPNNWRDVLTGGPAWQWHEGRQQYYLHSFDVKQPDLNWSNPEVRAAIQNVMRFWLDLGVDGFRVDAVYWMAKEPLLSDDPTNANYVAGEDSPYDALTHKNSRGWPFVFAYLTEMADVLKEEKYRESLRFMVTEAYPDRHNTLAAYMNFYVGMDPRVAAPFNFEGLSLPWEAGLWRKFLKSFHHALDMFGGYGVASYAFGNHDQWRMVTRFGEATARAAALMQLTLPGMAFVYYGEEIGMRNVHIPAEFVQDPAAKGDTRHGQGRDPERTPMQWSAGTAAGFSSTDQTWLPIAPDYAERNVDIEAANPDSFLNLYKRLGRLRQEESSLKLGSIEVLDLEEEAVLGFVRRHDGAAAFLTLVNFSDEAVVCHSPVLPKRLTVSSDPQTGLAADLTATLRLRPHEAALLELHDRTA